jgi:hypothetical protein
MARVNLTRIVAAATYINRWAPSMDTVHWQLLELIALLGAPFVFAFLATAFAWRDIAHRFLFLVVSVLVFAGLSALALPVATELFNPSGGGSAIYPSPQFNALVAHAVVVALLGFPVMRWLGSALRRA